MRMEIGRLAVVPLLITAGIVGACTENTLPSVLLGPSGEPAMVRQAGHNTFTLTGRVTMTIRRLDTRSPLGTVVETDVGEYSATVNADGSSDDAVQFSSGRSAHKVFASSQHRRRVGRWSRSFAVKKGGGTAEATFVASNGAPPNESELREAGVVISRSAKVWEPTRSGWRLTQSVTTVYDRGVPQASITLDFGEATMVESSSIRFAGIGAESLAIVPFDGSPASNVCEGELESAELAKDLYQLSCVGLIACFAGAKSCFGAIMAVSAAAVAFDSACDQVEICAAKY